jgi:CubicO group peptidase (beta-lactamase class C family)
MMFRHLHFAAAVASVLFALRASAQEKVPMRDDELIGLWGTETVLAEQVHGELLLERRGSVWMMRVGGFEGAGKLAADSLAIALPGGQGMLRAKLVGDMLHGFWVQPAGIASSYATPLHFRSPKRDAWRAEVNTVDAKFPLYLDIRRGADGVLHGVFRNPAVNWPGRAGWYRVERNGDNIDFIVPRTGKLQYRQPYDSAQRAIAFDFDGPVVLHPRTREQASGFVARSPSLPPYEYRAPVAGADGWRVAAASSVGIDETALRGIVRDIAGADPIDEGGARVHSLLVARRGRLVLDEYFYGHGPDQLHDLRSASKTLTSVMAGAAMLRGADFTMATRVRNSAITVGQLLTHTSGLACDDDDDASPGNEDTMQSQTKQTDWYEFFMDLPRAHAPGVTYAYCSAGINMVGSVIGAAMHTWLPEFFDQAIATPLQISRYAMNLMPNGEAYAGGGVHMLSRDFLKIGQLYLDEGRWNGTRVVSAAWVRESTAHQVDRSDGSSDGFGWHRHELKVGERSFETYEASGNGGQFVVVIPALQLVVATTAGNYGQYGVWRTIREQLVPKVMGAAR